MFVCEKCSKSFKSENGFKKHLEIVHMNDAVETIEKEEDIQLSSGSALHEEAVDFIDMDAVLAPPAEEEIEAKPFNIFKCPKCGADIDVNALGAHMRICQGRL